MKRWIIVLLAASLGTWALWQAFLPDSAAHVLPKMPSIDVAEVTQIDIVFASKAQASIELRRLKEDWVLLRANGAVAANKNAVERLLRDLSSMQAVRLLSKKTEWYEKFHLADRAVRVIFHNLADQILLDVFIGKQSTDLISTYVRLAGKPEALAVNRTLVWQIRRVPDSWKAAVNDSQDD